MLSDTEKELGKLILAMKFYEVLVSNQPFLVTGVPSISQQKQNEEMEEWEVRIQIMTKSSHSESEGEKYTHIMVGYGAGGDKD